MQREHVPPQRRKKEKRKKDEIDLSDDLYLVGQSTSCFKKFFFKQLINFLPLVHSCLIDQISQDICG